MIGSWPADDIFFDSRGDEDDATSTMSMQMEEFYAGAKDADYIIYNSTIEGELSSVDDLLAKSPLFEVQGRAGRACFTVHQRICISQQCRGTIIIGYPPDADRR